MREVFAVLCAALLAVLALAQGPNVKPPQMYVYTREPPEPGKSNQLICYGSGFYPPKIDISLHVNGKEQEDCHQSDLTFQDDWTYYTTKHTKIIYDDSAEYKCVVQHNGGEVKAYVLDKLK